MKHLTRKVVSLFTALTVAAGLCTLPQGSCRNNRSRTALCKSGLARRKTKGTNGQL